MIKKNKKKRKKDTKQKKMEEETIEDARAPEKICGCATGLALITKKPWPKNISLRYVKESIEKGAYKCIYISSAYRDYEILRYLYNDDIGLNQVFISVDDSQ